MTKENVLWACMVKGIKKVVGEKESLRPLQRLYHLNQFIASLNKKINHEPNLKPIRRIVGQPR